MLKAWAGRSPTSSFCPTGGITAARRRDYLALANVKVVGGSWLTPPDALAAADWPRIERARARGSGAARAEATRSG